MPGAVNKKEHFNLCFIFMEDKANNVLNKKIAAKIWRTVCTKTKKEHNGLSPPPNS